MSPVYDPRYVSGHDNKIGATVLQMNEALGPSEAIYLACIDIKLLEPSAKEASELTVALKLK